MSYNAIVLADSISPAGHRVTTLEVTFPRFILAEFNTPRVFARNSASSRAIPVVQRIEQIKSDPFVPEVFGKNKRENPLFGRTHSEETLAKMRVARGTTIYVYSTDKSTRRKYF